MTHPFHASVLANDPGRRGVLLRIAAAALAAVEPEAAVRRALHLRDGRLWAGEAPIAPEETGRVLLLAVGKAAPAMARAAVAVLEGRPVGGLVVANHPAEVPEGLELVVAGHPVPDPGSVEAGRRALELARGAGAGDLAICAISGGGSALLELPVEGVTLEGLVATTRLLLESGAPIEELNTVRKHLSAVKGGRLGEALAPARLLTLVLSDVVGNPLDAIASGPTVTDPTTFQDALAVLERYRVADRVPEEVLRHLRSGAAGGQEETPAEETRLADQVVLVVADGRAAAEGALAGAVREGMEARIVDTHLTGEARERATACLEVAETRPGLSIWSGETTVTVRGEGRGGRNQEAALAAALRLDGDRHGIFLALGTDGIDGPTDAAGGLVDGRTVARGREAGLDAADHLERNDSYPYLRAVGDQLRTGPTGTNVGDLWMVWSG